MTKPQAIRPVRKAVFPVAGMGTRFLPATKAVPKEMLPVVDKPVIQYAVEEAQAAGIEQFIFVTGRGKHIIEDHFDHAYELEALLSSREKTKELKSLLEALEKRSDEKVVVAWQAASALVLRHQLSALKFAAHYAPFAGLVPVSEADVLGPPTRRLLDAVGTLNATQCEVLAKPWRLEHAVSGALQQAVAKRRHLGGEEAVALAALTSIPPHLPGDAGWAAVRTAVHGARVLSRLTDLSRDEIVALWTPLQAAIPLESIEQSARDKRQRTRVRAAVNKAMD